MGPIKEIDPMQNDIISFAVEAFLHEMRERLEQAHGLAEAADACARVGQTAEGIELANKADEPIHDAEMLLGMIAWLARHDPGDARHLGAGTGVPDEGPATPVDAALAVETIRTFLHQAHDRLHRAVGIARAAELRAATAGPQRGAHLALGVEAALYEVKTLINAASLVNRLANDKTADPPN
jgi:hypothetical protein